MSIYLKDEMVLLDSGSVATSEDCCCAGGVCCDCDGNCDDATNQEDCEANGGQWFADQTCDDNPCDTLVKGACCVGTDCTIKTEACCNNDGGVYQGDDTVCDPNPCVTPPCCENAFFHDGNYYLTKQICLTGSSDYSQFEGDSCSASASPCSTTTIDPITCIQSTISCSGSSHIETGGGFSQDLTWTLQGNGHCGWDAFNFSPAYTIGLCGGCDLSPCPPGGFMEDYTDPCSNSCSENDPPFSIGSRNVEVTIVYSDPCIPV